jgi:hypothetical protein
MNKSNVTAEQKTAVWEASLKRWHDELTDEERSAFYQKRAQSIIKSDKAGPLAYDNRLPPDHGTNAWLQEFKDERFKFDELFEVA